MSTDSTVVAEDVAANRAALIEKLNANRAAKGKEPFLTTTAHKFKGIVWDEYAKRWLAFVFLPESPKTRHNVGYRDTPEEAARLRDEGLVKHKLYHVVPNFPAVMPRDWMIEHARFKMRDNAPQAAETAGELSVETIVPVVKKEYRGTTCFLNKSKTKPWRATLCLPGGKNKSLGDFATELDAARAYDRAVVAHGLAGKKKLNFPGEPVFVETATPPKLAPTPPPIEASVAVPPVEPPTAIIRQPVAVEPAASQPRPNRLVALKKRAWAVIDLVDVVGRYDTEVATAALRDVLKGLSRSDSITATNDEDADA